VEKTIKPLKAPFPYFGGKSKAVPLVWSLFGEVKNYVEPFCGTAAMLLGAPQKTPIETVNDADGFVANFWRAIREDPEGVAHWADYPVIEIDLTARHGWLVNRAERLKWSLEDPEFYDAKIAGWWVWGACNWIGGEWCASKGPWKSDGASIYKIAPTEGMKRILPHLGDAGKGINRKLPHLGDAGKGITRAQFILDWFVALSERLRDTRVACGDWQRVLSPSVTDRHGLTAVFLDPPYSKGSMDYAAGGVGTDLPLQVQAWCAENGTNPLLRIVVCGHGGEHSALESLGWTAHAWLAQRGYARSAEAVANRKSETVWASPACVNISLPRKVDLLDAYEMTAQFDVLSEAA
jgi:hypothetical protein